MFLGKGLDRYSNETVIKAASDVIYKRNSEKDWVISSQTTYVCVLGNLLQQVPVSHGCVAPVGWLKARGRDIC